MKQAAATDPEAFARELVAGNLTSQGGDTFTPAVPKSDDYDDMEVDGIGDLGQRRERPLESNIGFGKIPKAQGIVLALLDDIDKSYQIGSTPSQGGTGNYSAVPEIPWWICA